MKRMRVQLALVGAVTTAVTSIGFLYLVAAAGFSLTAFPGAVFRLLPSMLLVGAGVGLVASSTRPDAFAVLVFATPAWICGALASIVLDIGIGLPPGSYYWDFLTQISVGVGVGALPFILAWLLNRRSFRNNA